MIRIFTYIFRGHHCSKMISPKISKFLKNVYFYIRLGKKYKKNEQNKFSFLKISQKIYYNEQIFN